LIPLLLQQAIVFPWFWQCSPGQDPDFSQGKLLEDAGLRTIREARENGGWNLIGILSNIIQESIGERSGSPMEFS